MWKWLVNNWERVFFSLVGVGLIGYSLYLIGTKQVANASIVFGLGFLSFIYANVARFKKFKGLGFEAELWEDTKREAEGLIQRLRNVVSIYSREAIMSRVKEGRWSDGPKWETNWKLYDDLIHQHAELGQKIDFSDVKHLVDNYFLNDMIYPLYDELRKLLFEARSKVDRKIRDEFGPVIKDNVGHNARISQQREIVWELKDNFAVLSAGGNLAKVVLNFWADAKSKLKSNFDIDIDADQNTFDRLRKIEQIVDNRPVVVTSELIDWANRLHDS